MKCPDCQVDPGQEHDPGCDSRYCPECLRQIFGEDACPAHKLPPKAWSGRHPGDEECEKRGWYCQDGFGPHSRYGSFCPCSADAPGAMLDMNRLAYFKQTGKDALYDGCWRVPRK